MIETEKHGADGGSGSGDEPACEASPSEPDEPKSSPRNWRHVAFKIGLSTALTLFLLVSSIECLGRTAPSLVGPEIYLGPKVTEPDPLIGKHLRPGKQLQFTFISLPGVPDNIGFRDNGLDGKEGPRILALGDSFTFGDNVAMQEGWVEQLEAQLGSPVINAGVGATGPGYALGFLENYGYRLEPKVVIWACFAGNDVIDAALETGKSVRRFGAFRHWLQDHSASYRAAKLVVRHFASLGSPSETRRCRDRVNGEEQGFWPSLLELNSLEEPTESYTASLEALFDRIDAMNRFCHSRSFRFGVVIIPYKEQVYFDTAKQWLSKPERIDPDLPNTPILKHCESASVPVLDLTPVFRKNNTENLYLAFDGHWNEKGHALAARAILPFARKLLDDDPVRSASSSRGRTR